MFAIMEAASRCSDPANHGRVRTLRRQECPGPEATRMTATPPRSAIRLFSLTVLLALSTSIALAADWPIFKPGKWTFDRTLTPTGSAPERVSRTECTDPTADQHAQQEMLAKAGCQFTPLVQSGKTYRYSATCKMAGMTIKSESVLAVDSAEAYTITVDSTEDGVNTHEVLRARRIGDCAK